MALPGTGAISLGDIQNEFGGANPIGLSEYYKGGAYVTDTDTAPNVPYAIGGAISLDNFHGAAKVVTATYTTLFYPSSVEDLLLDVTWTNPNNALVSDNVTANASGLANDLSGGLRLYYNIGATIVSSATINWVKFHARGRVSNAEAEMEVALYDGNSAFQTSFVFLETTLSTKDSANLSVTPTRAQLINFFADAIAFSAGTISRTAYLDCAWIEVNYTQ